MDIELGQGAFQGAGGGIHAEVEQGMLDLFDDVFLGEQVSPTGNCAALCVTEFTLTSTRPSGQPITHHDLIRWRRLV